MPIKDPLQVGLVVAKSDNDTIINSDGELVGAFASTGVRLDATNTTDPTQDGQMVYVTGTGFRLRDAGSVFTMPTSGGGGGGTGLDEAYSINANVTVDEGASTWTDATAGALNTFELVKSGAGSGNLLDLSIDAALTGDAIAIDMNLGIAARAIFIDNGGTARTGSDFLVTDDSTGNHSVIDINSSGSGASVGYDWVGSFNGSPGGSAVSITMDNGDNLDTNAILVTRGTGVHTAPVLNIDDASTGSADIIDVDLTGVYTGNVFDFASAAAATGNVLNINLDNAVAMTGLHIEGSGVRTQPMIEVITDSTSSASLIDISVDGAITGTAALDIDMNLGVAANAIFIDVGGGLRTANVIDITNDGTGNVDVFQIADSNTGSGHIFDIDITSTRSGDVLNVVFSGVATGDFMNVDMDANLAGSWLVLDYGGGLRTEDMAQVTFDGTGTNPFWDINISNTGAGGTSDYWDIDVSGVFTGSILDVTYSAAATGDCISLDMTSALAAKAMIITGAGARVDDLFEINDSSTSNAHGMDWNISGVNTGNCLDVTYSANAATGNAIDLNMGTNVAGMAISVNSAATGTSGEGSALDVSHTGNLAAGADLMRLISTGNPSSTSNMFSLEQNTGAGSAGANVLHLNATGTNVEALEIEAGLMFYSTATANGAGNNETLVTNANISFYDPNGASRTGVILTAGLRDGQHVKVVNFANAAEDITFATAGTSNVAGGTSIVISRFEMTEFVWHAGTSLWYAGNLT